MQFLQGLVDPSVMQAIAGYLGSAPAPTPGAPSGNDAGSAAYQTYCASCHDPSSPGFVGHTVGGASAGDIAEAIGEVRQMQYLQGLVDASVMQEIAAYLRSVGGGGGGDD